MKKLSFLLLLCLVAVSLSAQLKIDLVLNATPPGNLSEWVNRREILTLLVTGQPGLPPQNLKIKTEIKTNDGTVVGTTDLARATTFTFAASAPTIFTATEVLPMENMIFNGKYRSSLQRTGKLPADNYMLCVQLVRPVDFTPASLVVCKSFYLAATQLPVLMKPYNEEVLDAKMAQTAITFRWSPVSPRTTALVTYRIQVFEVLPKQTPMQALRANQPLLDQEVRGTTQYIWQPQMPFTIIQDGNCEEKEFQDRKIEIQDGPDTNIIKTHPKNAKVNKDFETDPYVEGKLSTPKNAKVNKDFETDPYVEGKIVKNCMYRFIWTIQTLDDHGLPITQTDGNGEARSEPLIFYVDPNKNKGTENSSKKKGHIKVIKDDTGGGGG